MQKKLLLGCLTGLLVFTLLTPPLAADENAAAPKTAKMASLKLEGKFPESSGQMSLFGEVESNLRGFINRLDKASKDKTITGIVLHVRNPQIGRGKVNELRAAIARVRKSGKKVVAELESAIGSDYLIASACDQIILPPSGTLLITGVSAEVTFYKGLLDKVGVQADFVQLGDFKGAAEPYTRKHMSPEFRKQFEMVVDDYFDQLVSTIAKDRKLDPKKVKQLIDEGIFSASRAKEAGLVDQVAYPDQLMGRLQKEMKVSKLAMVKQYGKKKVDTDFSGPFGMMKLMQVLLGGNTVSVSKNKKIAVIYIVGVITSGKSSMGMFGGQSVGSDTIVKALRKVSKDETVKAIVLRVDSPGGSALASDLIWREIRRIKKPVLASMGDVAASGGYYVSMGADKIFAEPGTMTGSIGVLGGKLSLGGLYEKIGITTDVISRGKNSQWMSSTTGFSPSERKALKGLIQDIYNQFTTKAAEGRKMKLEDLKKLAGGRIWTGRQAAENKLVDKLGTLRDTLLEAKKLAGLKKEEKVELLILPKPTSIFEQLLGVSSDDASVPWAPPESKLLTPELKRILSRAASLHKVFSQPVATIMPFQIEIK